MDKRGCGYGDSAADYEVTGLIPGHYDLVLMGAEWKKALVYSTLGTALKNPHMVKINPEPLHYGISFRSVLL